MTEALDPLESLTEREREVAMLIVDGLSNGEIAESLGINIKTFDTHRGKVMKKLGLKNNVQLTRLCIANGLVAP